MTRITVDGILFDNDGVLVDSIGPAMRVWHEWALEWSPGHDPSVDFPHGTPAREIVRPLVPAESFDEAFAALEAAEVAVSDQIDHIPGAAALTTSLPGDGWVVVTSASRAVAEPRLRSAGHRPHLVVAVDDVTHGKPHPEPYLRGAELLGLDPSRVAVFEDAEAGVQAARAAGVGVVVGVGGKLDPSLVDVLVSDLTHVRRVPSEQGIVLEFDV